MSKRSPARGKGLSAPEKRRLALYENIPLSDANLIHLLGPGVKIVMYPDLWRAQTLDDVLGASGAAIILFESRPDYGHWCLLFRGAGGAQDLVEFFNPYGGWPDDGLQQIDEQFARATNQDAPYLSRLLIESPYRLSYNQYQFQRKAPGVKTCGRHCAARLLLRALSLDAYRDWIQGMAASTGTDADAVVTAITDKIRG